MLSIIYARYAEQISFVSLQYRLTLFLLLTLNYFHDFDKSFSVEIVFVAMASPEIEFRPTSSGFVEDNPNTPNAKSQTSIVRAQRSLVLDEKNEKYGRVSSTGQSPEPIIYHYLTFDTELPSPSTLTSASLNEASVPEAPDLRNYQSPFTWSKSRKTLILWLSCVSTIVTAYTAGSYSSASAAMAAEWHVSEEAIYVGITMFTTGFGIAPMVLAPFSEINGRYPVFVATGILFVICQIGCAVTQSYAGMLVARFFVGVGGSTFSTMVGGVVSDIYHAEDRNTPMALFAGAALLGTGLGPLCSGFIAQNVNWRWVFWHQVISCGLCILAVIVFFKETRGSVLLSRKAHLLNKWYEAREEAGLFGFEMPLGDDVSKLQSQRIRWKVQSDEDRESLAKMIGISLYRPFRKCNIQGNVFIVLTEVRSSSHRTCGLLLLALGIIQLGSSVPYFQLDPVNLHRQPPV